MTKFSLFCDGTEISNVGAGRHSNMAAVGNNKSILCSPQNSLVIFTFKVVQENYIGCILKPISETSQYDLLTNTELRFEDMDFIFEWWKQYFTNECREWVKYWFQHPLSILYKKVWYNIYIYIYMNLIKKKLRIFFIVVFSSNLASSRKAALLTDFLRFWRTFLPWEVRWVNDFYVNLLHPLFY